MIEPALDPTADTVDLEIERLAHARRKARGLQVAARRALALARRYRDEEGPRGARETACVSQALAWRSAARGVRSGLVSPGASAGPGLARTSIAPSPASRRAG